MKITLSTLLKIFAGLGFSYLLVPTGGCVQTAAVAEPVPAPRPRVEWKSVPIAQIEFSRDGKYLLLFRVSDRVERSQSRIEIWDVRRRSMSQAWELAGRIDSLAVSDDFREVAIAVSWGEKEVPIQIWNTFTGQRVRLLDRANAGRVTLAVDGEHVLTGDSNGHLRWIDTETGQITGRQTFSPMLLTDIKVSPGQRYLAASQNGAGDSAGIWEIKSGRFLGGFGPEEGTRISWSPDGTLLAADSDTATTVVHVPSGKVLRQFPAAGSNMMPTISADNKWLVNGGYGDDPEDETTVWSLKTGRQVGSLAVRPPVQFSPAEGLLACADTEGTKLRFLPMKEVLHPSL